ncbi:MAG: DUF2225 domain-containing protein [Candidatus Zixiibacteriota bacterium]
MAMESPFLLFKVECPICKTINEFETIRVGAYAEEDRDTDFCPRNIKWRFPRYQAYNPLVFFTGTCTNCYYSREFTNAYKEWKNDVNFKTYRLKTVKSKHLDQLAAADSVVKLVGTAIDVNRYPNESAILKLLLAIYDEQLADHYSRLDVGRFYLRVAWVFRDMEHTENPNLILLREFMREIEESRGRLTEGAAGVRSDADAFAETIHSHFNSSQLTADIKAQMLSFGERYDQQIRAVHDRVSAMEQQISDLTSLIAEYRTTLIGNESGSGQVPFGQYPSFVEFLHRVQRVWSGAVTNEREALERSVQYYKEAFANGKDIAPGNQQIQASYLIAELSRRIGDFDEAKQYFTSTIKSGQEFIYQNRHDSSRTALARKILELAIEQGRMNLAASRPA